MSLSFLASRRFGAVERVKVSLRPRRVLRAEASGAAGPQGARLVWTGLAGLGAAAALAVPAARTETLAEAVALAYQANPTLRAQRAELRAVDEGYVQARAGYGPTVSVDGGGELPGRPPGPAQRVRREHGGPNAYALTGNGDLSLVQPLYTGGQTAAAVGVGLRRHPGRARAPAADRDAGVSGRRPPPTSTSAATCASSPSPRRRWMCSPPGWPNCMTAGGWARLSKVDVSQGRGALARRPRPARGVAGAPRRSAGRRTSPPSAAPRAILRRSPSWRTVAAHGRGGVRGGRAGQPSSSSRPCATRRGRGRAPPRPAPSTTRPCRCGWTSGPRRSRPYDRTRLRPQRHRGLGLQPTDLHLRASAVRGCARPWRGTTATASGWKRPGAPRCRPSPRRGTSSTATRGALAVERPQVEALRVAAEGQRVESRVGLRSVIDLLNAEQELESGEITLAQDEHDAYLAQRRACWPRWARWTCRRSRRAVDHPLRPARRLPAQPGQVRGPVGGRGGGRRPHRRDPPAVDGRPRLRRRRRAKSAVAAGAGAMTASMPLQASQAPAGPDLRRRAGRRSLGRACWTACARPSTRASAVLVLTDTLAAGRESWRSPAG